MPQRNPIEKETLALVCYLLTSARQLFEEPKRYGPLRLIEVTDRLINLLETMGRKDRLLEEIRIWIGSHKLSILSAEPDFIHDLDEFLLDLVSRLEQECWG